MSLHLHTENSESGNDDDKVNLTDHLCPVSRHVHRVEDNPSHRPRVVSEPNKQVELTRAPGLGIHYNRDHPCHRSGLTSCGHLSQLGGISTNSGPRASTRNMVRDPASATVSSHCNH